MTVQEFVAQLGKLTADKTLRWFCTRKDVRQRYLAKARWGGHELHLVGFGDRCRATLFVVRPDMGMMPGEIWELACPYEVEALAYRVSERLTPPRVLRQNEPIPEVWGEAFEPPPRHVPTAAQKARAKYRKEQAAVLRAQRDAERDEFNKDLAESEEREAERRRLERAYNARRGPN